MIKPPFSYGGFSYGENERGYIIFGVDSVRNRGI
jgi:hypothetical protein